MSRTLHGSFSKLYATFTKRRNARQFTIWYESVSFRLRSSVVLSRRSFYHRHPPHQFDVVTPPPSRVGTPVSERTATPFLDERGPKTQLVLLNRKSSLRSVSRFSNYCFFPPPILTPPTLRTTGETTADAMVAETEACNDRVLLKTEDTRSGRHDDGKHGLIAVIASPLQISFVKLLSSYITHMRPLPPLLATVSSLYLIHATFLSLCSTFFASCLKQVSR